MVWFGFKKKKKKKQTHFAHQQLRYPQVAGRGGVWLYNVFRNVGDAHVYRLHAINMRCVTVWRENGVDLLSSDSQSTKVSCSKHRQMGK